MSDFAHQLQQQLQPTAPTAHHEKDLQSSIALSGLRPAPVTGPGKAGMATQVDMDMAISDLWDMQESVMFKFIVIGDLGRAIHQKHAQFMGTIKVAMPLRYLTPEVKSLFTTWKYKKEKYGYSYLFTPPIRWEVKIPIEIHVIERHYDFFDNPDVGFFGTNEFQLPNPFSKYWNARNLIK